MRAAFVKADGSPDPEYRSFEAPLLKVLRADMLISELRAAMGEYSGSVPAYRTANLSDDGTSIEGCIFLEKMPPNRIALITGDVIHNLRSSLDVMANDLADLAGHYKGDVAFPFSSTEDGFEAQIKRSRFSKTSDEAQEIVRRLKPYPSGNRLLHGLHELSIRDKHRMICPVAGAMSMLIVKTYFHRRYTEVGNQGPYSWRIRPDQRSQEEMALGDRIPIQIRFEFGLNGPFQFLEVLPTLLHLRDNTLGVVQAFAALYGIPIERVVSA